MQELCYNIYIYLRKGTEMSFLEVLKSVFSSSMPDDAYYLYVRCHRCGEIIRTRIDLQQSLSQSDDGGYTINKTLIGNRRCFERIEVTLNFNENRRLVNRDITGGEFVTKNDFEAQLKP